MLSSRKKFAVLAAAVAISVVSLTGCAPQYLAGVQNAYVSMEPCGGDLPPCYVKQRESGGNYRIRNNSEPGAACGAWQFIGSTWASVMTAMGRAADLDRWPEACDAPPVVQDEAAAFAWAKGAGCGHWSAC